MLLEFAASLLPMTAALATPKRESSVILVTPPYNRMTNKELDERAERKRRWFAENPGEFKVQKNAYSMHATTERTQTPSPWRVLASPGLGICGLYNYQVDLESPRGRSDFLSHEE
jgi:hypothetical protein